MALRKTGLEFQAKGYRQFIRSTEAVNKATERVEATFARISKMRVQLGDMRSTLADLRGKSVKDLVPKAATDRLGTFTRGIGELTGRLGFLPPQLQGAVGGLGQLSGALGGVAGGLSLATAGVAIFGAALLGLGMRGAAMPGVIQAFDVATQRAGVYSQVLLKDLREASRGTIADMQLMKTANVALAGASEGLAQELGKGGGLAGLMEVARAQARATGQDVGFLFDSLVSGVKRSSPMLIDNTGLVLKVGEANQRFAESIGKSVEALTAEEKQIALLNATLEAGRLAVETYGQGALQASERIAIIRTTITNTLDKLAVAVQPLFNYILAIGQTFISAVVWPLQNLVIPVIYEVANALFGPMTRAWERTTGIISDVFQPVAQLIHRWLVVLVGVIRGFGAAWDWLLRTVTKVLGPVAGFLKKYLVEPVSKALDPAEFARRAGNAFGALAQGILWAANTYIFPAVIFIAEFIADFLMGFSPPKKGPLSRIDEGGANVMRAWLQGFMGTSLQPVKDVAAEVNAELGKIGRLAHDQVEARIAQLDAALQPFIDRLDIAKAKMEALIEPLRGVQDALQKKLARQLELFTKGEVDAEAVRALDRQNAALSERIQAAEDMTVEAEYQLALKKSEQAVERALLAIQARRVKKTEDAAAATGKLSTAAGKVAEETEKAAKGGGATDEETPVGGGASSLGGDPIGDWLGVSSEEVDEMWGEISTAFADGFDDVAGDDLAKAKENWGSLKTQLDRIGDSKPFQTLQNAVSDIFGTGDGSLWKTIENFGNDVSTFFTSTLPGYITGIPGVLQTNLVDPFTSAVSGVFDSLIGGGGRAAAAVNLRATVEQIPTSIGTWLKDLATKVKDNLVKPFTDKVTDIFHAIVGGGGRDQTYSLKSIIEQIPSSIYSWLTGLPDQIKENLVQPFIDKVTDVWNELTGDGEESLKSRLSNLPGEVADALKDLPTTLIDSLLNPFDNVITQILTKLGDIGLKVLELLGLGGGDPNQGDWTIDPQTGKPVRAQKGAKGGKPKADELWVVGEQGWEFFRPNVPGTIIPHRKSVDMLRNMAPARTVPAGGGVNNNTTNNSTVLTVNFNGGDNRQNLRMRLSEARALL